MLQQKIKKVCDKQFYGLQQCQKLKIYQKLYDIGNFSKKVYVAQTLKFALKNILLPNKNFEKNGSCFFSYSTKTLYNNHSLLEYAEKYDIISFDIFDTILFRKVDKPSDIFTLVASTCKVNNFKDLRITAEQESRKIKFTNEKTYEVTLDDIYNCNEILLKNKDLLIQLELNTEKENIYENNIVKDLILSLKKSGKTLICTSDMYLSSRQIKSFFSPDLLRCFDKFYVSSEQKYSKSNGKLFDVLENEYPNKKILHLGDNFYSDVLMNKNFKNIDSIQFFRNCNS